MMVALIYNQKTVQKCLTIRFNTVPGVGVPNVLKTTDDLLVQVTLGWGTPSVSRDWLIQ